MKKYKERIPLCPCPIAQRLLEIVEDKESNIAVAADCTTSRELLALAERVGPHICMLKTHIDILEDFSLDTVDALSALAAKHRFVLFEDRKFADIAAIVQEQYAKGLYRIASWADLVTVHALPGPGILAGLKHVGLPLGRGALLLAEMSSAGTLARGAYAEDVVRMAKEHADFVVGVIAQRRLSSDPTLLHFTPGIQCAATSDGLGQTYRTPQAAIEAGSDILIIGRGIARAEDPAAQAAFYREQSWKAYVLH